MTPRFVTTTDEEYPPLLSEIKPAVPSYWILGRPLTELRAAVAVVGPRNPTPYGIEIARTLASGFAFEGIVVVSGMARGVDTAAHEAALEAHGLTIAVLGTGIDVPYPAENTGLYRRILGNGGAIVSEQEPGMRGFKANFPKRNRIIAGLSLAVVVVQAGSRSGALSTAARARDNNRDVFAVPGDVRSPLSAGVHALLRDGAGLCERPSDVIEGIARELERAGHRDRAEEEELPAGLCELDQLVVRALSRSFEPLRAITSRTGLTHAVVERALIGLELRGFAIAGTPGTYKRT